jgi:hypothetical protein
MKNTIIATMLTFLLLPISGCGGGGAGGGTTTPPVQTISGVAAAGKAIVGTVFLKDSAAVPTIRQADTTLAGGGKFTLDVTGLTKPFMLKVVGTSGSTPYTLYSLAADQGTANVNPLTNLVVAVAAARGDLETLYSASNRSGMANISGNLTKALSDVRATLSPLIPTYPVLGSANPITDLFSADGSGLDGVLDLVAVTVDTLGNIRISDSGTSGVAAITKNVTTAFSTHTISGTVSSANSLGLAGVVVSARSVSTSSVKNVVTDGAGKYSISGLVNGDYSITLSRSDVHSDLLGTSAFNPPAAKVVTVSDSASASADFSCNLASYTLSGNVARLSSGEPMANVAITLIARGSDGILLTSSDGFFTTVTDAAGNYSLSGLPAAFYSLTPALSGFAFALQGAGPGVTADNFSVGAPATQLSLTGRPTSDATGGVTGN